ncbi:MAG: hypothetical protein N3A72_11310 [bacterium]|nr:hypothetical protein [bacterium]
MEAKSRNEFSEIKSTCYRHPTIVSQTVCFGCGRAICHTCITVVEGKVYCPNCYIAVEVNNEQIAERNANNKWYYSIPFVLLMLFAIAGPFALPLLWKSPEFNTTSKFLLTTLVILITIFLIWFIYWLSVTYLIPRYRDMMQILR